MPVTNPLSGEQQKLFVAMADPVEEKLLHMVTADPARTPTFTPFAQGDYFLSALVGTPAPCAGQRPVELRLPANDRAAANQTFAWNHGGIQPEIRDDLGRLGRAGRREEGEPDRQGLDRPHRHPADDALAARAARTTTCPTAAS